MKWTWLSQHVKCCRGSLKYDGVINIITKWMKWLNYYFERWPDGQTIVAVQIWTISNSQIILWNQQRLRASIIINGNGRTSIYYICQASEWIKQNCRSLHTNPRLCYSISVSNESHKIIPMETDLLLQLPHFNSEMCPLFFH